MHFTVFKICIVNLNMQDKYLSAKIIIFLIHVDPEDGDGTFL